MLLLDNMRKKRYNDKGFYLFYGEKYLFFSLFVCYVKLLFTNISCRN